MKETTTDSSPEKLKCPLHGQELSGEIYRGRIELNRCPCCGGVWLTAKQLERLERLSFLDGGWAVPF